MKETNSELAKRIFESSIYKHQPRVFIKRGSSRGFCFKLENQDDPEDFTLHERKSGFISSLSVY